MRANASDVAKGDTLLPALILETAVATVDAVVAESRRRPIAYPEWLSLQDPSAYQGADAYLKDENGSPVPETVRKLDFKAMRFILEWYRPERWGKHPKIDAPRQSGVLIVGGDVPKKPEYNTTASIKARKWKAAARMI